MEVLYGIFRGSLNLNANTTAKVLYKRIIEKKIKTQYEIFEAISENNQEVIAFKKYIIEFLNSN